MRVAIRLSSSKEIDALVADLGSDRSVTREAAVARLTIIGARAVARLTAIAASSEPAEARVAALRTLDAIGDPRARAAVFAALADTHDAVAAAAATAARGYLHGRHGAEALDHLTRTALDRARSGKARAAAVRAVGELDAATIAPLIEALRGETDADVRTALAAALAGATERDPAAALAAAADGELPDDPHVLRDTIAQAGADAALPVLLRVVEAVRAREGAESAPTRAGWTAARAAAHLALAGRGSRIALYDLRESLESADARLPVELLAALTMVGDATCLEAIAAAYARTRDAWWREHLAAAFQAIVQREGLTRRHAVLKKIEKRWPGGLGGAGSAGAPKETGQRRNAARTGKPGQ
jgi:hypothetical protein